MDIKLTDALLIAAFSSAISFGVQFFFKWRDEKNHTKSFEVAILAEIKAMMSIIEKRKYLEDLSRIDSFHNMGDGQKHLLIVDVQENYCPIYYGNLTKISLLSEDIVADIVEFYSLIASVIQDVKPGGILTDKEYATKETFQNTYSVLKNAIEIGNRLITKK